MIDYQHSDIVAKHIQRDNSFHYSFIRAFGRNDSLWTSANGTSEVKTYKVSKRCSQGYNFIHHERNDMSCFPFTYNDNLLNQINLYTNYLCTI